MTSESVTQENWYVGMKVTRGKDWQTAYGNQDISGVGTITRKIYGSINCWRCHTNPEVGLVGCTDTSALWVTVKWPDHGEYCYRAGHDAKYDLYRYDEGNFSFQ